jgi:hypothetical protein
VEQDGCIPDHLREAKAKGLPHQPPLHRLHGKAVRKHRLGEHAVGDTEMIVRHAFERGAHHFRSSPGEQTFSQSIGMSKKCQQRSWSNTVAGTKSHG